MRANVKTERKRCERSSLLSAGGGECCLQRLEASRAVVPVDQHIHANFTRVDQLDVDAFGRQCAEHADRDAGVTSHPDTRNGQLRDRRTAADAAAIQHLGDGLGDLQRFLQAVARHGEAQAGGVGPRGVALHNHVDKDTRAGNHLEDLGGCARLIGDVVNGIIHATPTFMIHRGLIR